MTLTFRSTVVFDFNYPSVSAILLWPHCPLLSYRIKSCTGHSEDTNRLRGACKKRQSERWPKCGSGFGAAVLKTKLIQGHRLSEHAHFDKRTRTGLCDTEHIPKTPNNPVWSFKSSHENVNFISAFFYRFQLLSVTKHRFQGLPWHWSPSQQSPGQRGEGTLDRSSVHLRANTRSSHTFRLRGNLLCLDFGRKRRERTNSTLRGPEHRTQNNLTTRWPW